MADSVCFLCPGQGAQSPGMGRALYEHSEAARTVFALGSEQTGVDLKELCIDAESARLNLTDNAQLALFTVAAAAAAFLEERGIRPGAAAGFSFGECSALYVAGVLELADAFSLVQIRARLMREASDHSGGAMCAVLGLAEERVVALARGGGAEAVNFNCPGQTVMSGPREAVEKAAALCRAEGAKRTVMLDVSGAFHTAAMEPAAQKLPALIAHLQPRPPRIPLYGNERAEPLPPDIDLAAHLASQMTHPVLWRQSMERCAADGFTQFYELGPGRTLGGFLKKIAPGVSCAPLAALLPDGA